jgi:hypothetical protein
MKYVPDIMVVSGKERHSGWSKVIDDETYILCFLRDPVKLACSLYAYFQLEKIDPKIHIEGGKDYVTKEIAQNLVINKEDFLKWIEHATDWHNIQAKNFLISDNLLENIRSVKIDKELLYNRLNRVNLLVKSDHMKKWGAKNVLLQLSYDLHRAIYPQSYEDSHKYSNPASLNLYRSLTDEDKEFVLKFFDIDNEIYNSDKLKYLEFI